MGYSDLVAITPYENVTCGILLPSCILECCWHALPARSLILLACSPMVKFWLSIQTVGEENVAI